MVGLRSGKQSELRTGLPPLWLTPEHFEALVEKHRYRDHLQRGGLCVFEFPARTALPAGVGLNLLSFLNQLANISDGSIRLEFASADGLFGYLNRNGFLQFLAPAIQTNPERPHVSSAELRRGQTPGLVEIVALVPGTTGPARRRIVNRLVDGLIDFYPPSQETDRLRNHVFTVLGELVDNVFTHSWTPIPGYAILQAYNKRRLPRIQIAVSDSGVGIPASLREALGGRVKGQSDADLIVAAFVEGLSRRGSTGGHGCGLPTCARLAAQYGSTLFVRTPSAQVELHPAGPAQEAHEATIRDLEEQMAGTHICLEFFVRGVRTERS
jgi:hypothetical protein